MVLFGEVYRDVGNLIVRQLLRRDLGVCGDLSAPAEPNARFLRECRLHGNLEPAGARLCIFLGNGDSIRDYDELPQKRSSPRNSIATDFCSALGPGGNTL